MKTLLLSLFFLFSVALFGQNIGETDTPFDTDGWDVPEDSTQYYNLPIYRLLSNPGGWINWNQFWIDSLFNELIVYTDTNQLFIRNDTLFINPDFLENAIEGLDTLDWITLTPQSTAPPHVEGRIYYDATDHSLSYYNEEADVTLNIGREMYIRGYNNTGSTITNGTPVYGDPQQAGLLWEADASDDSTSRTLGLATHDIEDTTFGYVTTYGLVRFLNTQTLSVGPVYLSETTGELTSTKPDAPANIIRIGACGVVDNDSGIVFVDPQFFNDVNGIATATFADSTIAINASSNTQVTNATNNAFIYVTEVGHDVTLSGDTLYFTDTGIYDVAVTMSFQGGNGGQYKFTFKDGGTTIPNFAGERKTTSADVGSATILLSHKFDAGDALTLWVEDLGTSSTVTMKHCTILVEQVR